jgi:hypothetical protein
MGAQKRPAPPTNTGNDRRKVRRISAGQGMTTIASSMESSMDSYADKITDAFQRAPRSEALEVAGQAIETIEDEEGFSGDDLTDAAVVIAQSKEVANVYLHLKGKAARTSFLLRCMRDLNKSSQSK